MVIGAVAVVAFLLFWEWVGTSGVINPMFSSSPSRIIKAGDRLFFDGGIGAVFGALFAGNLAGAWTAIAKGSIWKDMWVSGQELFWGYGLCLVIGIPFGLALGWFRRLSYVFEPFISALYATPSVALLPLYIIWFGIGINSKHQLEDRRDLHVRHLLRADLRARGSYHRRREHPEVRSLLRSQRHAAAPHGGDA
jgi:NitT/TauT family transport system permease protein